MQNHKQKGGIWKPFAHLIRVAKMPWFFILLKMIAALGVSQLMLMFPDYTQRVLAGDTSMAAIGVMIAILFGQAIATAVSQFIGTVTRTKITLSFRKFMIRKTLRLPVPYYDKNMADRLISRTTQDTTLLSDFMGDSVPGLPGLLYRFVGTLVILFAYDWRLMLLEALMIPIIVVVAFVSGRVNYRWTDKTRGKAAELTGYLAEALSNIPLIKVFVREKLEEKKGHENIDELYRTQKKYTVFASIVSFFTSAESVIQTLICVIGGVYLVSHDYITLEVWIAFYLYSQMLMRSFSSFSNLWDVTKIAQGAARRMAEVSMEEDEPNGGDKIPAADMGDIAFEQVAFRYDDKTVLEDLTFVIPAGGVTAVVGRSGAGKSTVFALLERFYTPDAGRITAGGVDVREYDMAAWRRNIGYVPQESQMLSGTIRYNMTYGLDREVSEEELIQAAKQANAYDFIQSFSQGFDTEVGERGSKLSGGQRQRIAIARAILKNPRILLLDEATSSLDADATYAVEQALERLKEGRTTIMIAHDLSSVRNADQIVLLDQKQAIACGNHEELKAKSPLYRDMLEKQRVGAML